MTSEMGLTKTYAAVVGVVLVLVGLLGFISNPIVGDAGGSSGGDPLFVTGTVHNIVHLATGLLALYIAFMLKGDQQNMAIIGFGILYIVVLVLTLVDGDLFGILAYPVNTLDHLLHAALGVLSIGVGYMGRGSLSMSTR